MIKNYVINCGLIRHEIRAENDLQAAIIKCLLGFPESATINRVFTDEQQKQYNDNLKES